MRSPIASPEAFVLTLWTNDPAMARQADGAGVDRIGVDLERLGKQERQGGRGTWISPHREEDLDALPVMQARRFARINPVHEGTAREVEALLARGAQVLMLPMTMDAVQIEIFVRCVRGRATTVALVEHAAALKCIDEIARVDGLDEVHIGLNDLALSLGLRNRWLALADERIVDAAAAVRGAGRRFGLGGIGRAGDTELPVPSSLVYAQYARTGARASLLARSFLQPGIDLAAEVRAARYELAEWCARDRADIEHAHRELVRCAAAAPMW